MRNFMEDIKKLFSVHGLLGLLLTSLGIGYVLNTLDIIPDTMPIVGFFDDAAFIILTFFLARMIVRNLMGKFGKSKK